MAQPLVIGLIAVPLIVQSYGIFAISLVAARWLGLPHNVAGPACLIGTSNFFEYSSGGNLAVRPELGRGAGHRGGRAGGGAGDAVIGGAGQPHAALV